MQQNTYDQVANEYARYLQALSEQTFSFNHDLIIPLLLDQVGDVEGLAVLDAGCGEGIVARLLVERGAKVVGIDVSPRLVDLARAQDAQGKAIYQVRDLSRPLPEYQSAFDVAVSNLVLNDVPDYRGFITTMGMVTKPQGRIVLSMNNPYSALIREKVHSYFDSGQATLYNMARAGVTVYYFHRTFAEYVTAFREAGFVLKNLVDVKVPEAIVENLPEQLKQLPYSHMHGRFPFFMILEFVRGM
jgi:2-polyprenyl-3-methyl-5-hydroxy-6-metoxy-1,4-benzoquinol methylase